MTESEAKGFIQGKLDCMNKRDVFVCKYSDECDSCQYCYSQGTFREQKEAFSMAIKALEKQIPKKPIFNCNLSDTSSLFHCECGHTIKVRHDIGIMNNSNAPNYCSKCGCRLDWSDEE